MNKQKKLGVIGLVVIIIGNSVFNLALGGSALGRSASPSQGAAFINARYFSQKDPYFCGQASAQMALYLVQGKVTSQFKLEDEMNFIEGAGTRNFNMFRPFENRDIDIIRVRLFSGPDQLRESVDKEQYSIINIRFDENSNSGHYVLVTGYNETGFFVNDPWPEEWGKPTGRDTGKNAFVGTEMLVKLWAFRLYWVITVAGPNSIGDPVLTEAQGDLKWS